MVGGQPAVVLQEQTVGRPVRARNQSGQGAYGAHRQAAGARWLTGAIVLASELCRPAQTLPNNADRNMPKAVPYSLCQPCTSSAAHAVHVSHLLVCHQHIIGVIHGIVHGQRGACTQHTGTCQLTALECSRSRPDQPHCCSHMTAAWQAWHTGFLGLTCTTCSLWLQAQGRKEQLNVSACWPAVLQCALLCA
jgi:hypothetical protein